MSERPCGGATTPRGNPPGETLRGEEVCDSFETAWLAGGVPPQIESFLVVVDETERPALLARLVVLDTQHRQRTGETVTAGHYRERFPDLDPAMADDTVAAGGTPAAGALLVQESTGSFLTGETSPVERALRPLLPRIHLFDEEVRALLRRRLMHLHLVFVVFFLLLVPYAFTGIGEGLAYGASKTLATALGAGLCFYVGASAVFLWRSPGMRMRTLRRLELALFGGLMLTMGTLRLDGFLAYSAVSPDPRWARVAAERIGIISVVPFFFVLTFYGVYIPNTRLRSLLVVSAFATIPLLALALAAAMNPPLRQFFPSIVALNLLGVGLVGVLAVFNASRINTLQRQAYEARRAAQQVGPYSLKRQLGRGGMGEVYLAEHRLLKRPCAVKMIRPELSSDAGIVARFIREVEAVTKLTHLHTVRVYDYGQTDDGVFYYVMEHLDGQSLDDLVRNEGPLAPGRAVQLLRQVCGALAEAHATGLVHRDLKPGNIFVATLGGEEDMAKLLDFGLVHDLAGVTSDDRLTRTGTVMGTPAYMSPEQAGGEPSVDSRADIYSLGTVAFFALTGRPPFDAPSVGKVLSAHLTQTPLRVDAVCAGVPSDLSDVIVRCLAKDAADRYQTAAELEAALARCACAVAQSSHTAGNVVPETGQALQQTRQA